MSERVADILAAECPKCGAAAKFDAGQDRGFCQYCGTQIVLAQKKVIHQHFGESVGTPEAYLKMANAAISGENYEAAIGYLDSILRMRPDDADAWIAKGEACKQYVVHKTQISTRPIRNKKGQVVGTETYTEEVPTYPRAQEGEVAYRHGLELLEAEIQAASDPTPQLTRLSAILTRVEGPSATIDYFERFVARRPQILYPHEVLVEHHLDSRSYTTVARAVRRALRTAEGGSDSAAIQRGRNAVESKLGILQTRVESAQARLATVKTHQQISLGVLAVGLLVLFIEQALGFMLLIAGALYYYFGVHAKQSGLRNAQRAHDELAQAWTGA